MGVGEATSSLGSRLASAVYRILLDRPHAIFDACSRAMSCLADLIIVVDY